MATETFYRKANVTSREATDSIHKRFPNAELLSFVKKAATAEEAIAANAKEGDSVYVATVRTAEFPPSDDSGSEAPEAPAEPKEEAPAESEDATSEDDPDAEAAPAPGGEGEEAGGKPKELKGEELTNHLLQELLDAVKGGGALGPDAAGPGGPDAAGLDLPDIGAPDQGDGLAPPGGLGGKPPLPPPVREKSPVGVGAFASVAGKAEIHFVRETSDGVGNKTIIAEAAEHAPTHRVAKIQRTGSALINGETVNLAERKLAVVTLIAK